MLLREAYEGACAERCQAILDKYAGPHSPDWLVLLHTGDPWSRYYCLLAHAGSRDPESLPTSLSKASVELLSREIVRSDARDKPGLSGRNRGLLAREGIAADDKFVVTRASFLEGEVSVLLSVGVRSDVGADDIKTRIDTLLADLEFAFKELNVQRCGATMESCLDHNESQARDFLRAAVSQLGPRPTLDQVAGEMTRAVERSFNCWAKDGLQIRAGIYMFTGAGWYLCGAPDSPPYLPGEVRSAARHERRAFDSGLIRATAPNAENAFEWVHAARTPVLLSQPLSATWAKRLSSCYLSVPRRGGVCISPISDYFDATVTIGLLVVSVDDYAALGTHHAFLVKRLAQSVTVYLSRLLPVHGFPWWPDARLSRGGAQVTKGEVGPNVKRIITDLLPTGSSVEVKGLPSGLTESEVFQLTVYDDRNLVEIPRVLKIGPAEAIGDELFRYYRYVNNKRVGGHARVDAARGYPTEPYRRDDEPGEGRRGTAAILYTFAGAGADVLPWSSWARDAELGQVEGAIDDLMDQLDCWHGRRRTESRTLADLVLTEQVLTKQKRRSDDDPQHILVEPTIADTVGLLDQLRDSPKLGLDGPSTVHTCLCHGDPHCDNLFAVFDRRGSLKDVAIIDWGKVGSRQHPITDICILLADLVFRVRRGGEEDKEWLRGQMLRWVGHFGCTELEGSLVVAVHLLRMLAWRRGDSRAAWLDVGRRAEAWHWLKAELAQHELIEL